MARPFLSPGERRELAKAAAHELPEELREPGWETEADVLRTLIDTFDAHMLDVAEPPRAVREGETAQMLLEEQRRYGKRDFGRRAFNWD